MSEPKGTTEILLTLFVHGELNKSQVLRHLKELKEVSWAQVLKVIQNLEQTGFVEHRKGSRGAMIYGLTDKAFFYIVLKESDPYSKHPYGMKRFFQVIFPKTGYSIPTDGAVKSFFAGVFQDAQREVRKRVNFDFFDYQYAQWTYTECLVVALYQNLKTRARELARIQVGSSLGSILRTQRTEILPILEELRDQAGKHAQFCKDRESLFSKMIELMNNPKTQL